ncbi:hypothetical protein BKA70DRAFT_1223608 [Coprinopsis sp. MPI-PUGE-AT-0042]|nr:hypothetical protein BKA70DRAFT_1223608 [Coprinopsis sp. MPI-PUGE-AT-0042]
MNPTILTCAVARPPSKWVSAAKGSRRLALSLWMGALQASHDQRVSALASRLHLPSSTVGPQASHRMHRAKALGLDALQQALRGFTPLWRNISRDPAEPFARRHQRLWISNEPFSYPPQTTSGSRKENGSLKQHAYLALVFIALFNRLSKASTPRSRSPLQFLQTRDSSKEFGQVASVALSSVSYFPQDEVTPTTSSAAEPSLSVPERKLDADAGEREAAQALEGVATVFGTIASCPPPAASSSRCYKATRKLSFALFRVAEELRKWICHPAALPYSRIEQSMKDRRWVAR